MAESPAVFLVILRWLHVVAAALWLGGGLLLLALRARGLGPGAAPSMPWGRAAGHTLRLGVGVFIITGALLTAVRLAEPNVPVAYVVLLAGKTALAFAMFWLALPRSRRGPAPPAAGWSRWTRDRTFWIVVIALVVYLLSVILNELIERAALSIG
ncbi:MAG: hypothetical protein OXG43_03530 [Chloroflexi bacterium]|nr:hypothetical protein [Chloroflexota bacterium]